MYLCSRDFVYVFSILYTLPSTLIEQVTVHILKDKTQLTFKNINTIKNIYNI